MGWKKDKFFELLRSFHEDEMTSGDTTSTDFQKMLKSITEIRKKGSQAYNSVLQAIKGHAEDAKLIDAAKESIFPVISIDRAATALSNKTITKFDKKHNNPITKDALKKYLQRKLKMVNDANDNGMFLYIQVDDATSPRKRFYYSIDTIIKIVIGYRTLSAGLKKPLQFKSLIEQSLRNNALSKEEFEKKYNTYKTIAGYLQQW